ncbi:MAG TPA: hypothetical protein VNA21_08835, partial [Steroidobacteraceae bacterium]|nr:hypothetical protein [Steroidobacteraceae bacterium]
MPIDTDDLFRTDETGHLLQALQADHTADAMDTGLEAERAAEEASESALWFPHSPFLLPLSGIYHRRRPDLPIFIGDQLRLDVDGALPQMAASGLRRSPLYRTVHWVANLTRVGINTWEGAIIYRDGDTSLLPHSTVRIQAWRFGLFSARRAAVTFSGPGLPSFTHVYYFTSAYYDRVEFEFDSTSDAHPQYQIDTAAHPTRPSDLPIENLDAEKVFRRAGFDVQISSGASTVPIADAGTDAVWSDTEMHDAMQAHWSRFSSSPFWGVWVFTAALHEDTSDYDGDDLGGIMFDS